MTLSNTFKKNPSQIHLYLDIQYRNKAPHTLEVRVEP